MKRTSFYSLLVVFLLLNACKKTDTYHSDQLTDYLQLQRGKYITYRLDSLVFLNFGTQSAVRSYLAKDVIDDSVTDNLGRPSWRVIRYISDTTGIQPWTPIETYLITATRETVEVLENNLRFQKLKLPITNGFSWKGNSYIYTDIPYSEVSYLYDWDYTYDSVGMPYTVLGGSIPSSLIVHQRDSSNNFDNSLLPVANPGPSQTITLPVNTVTLDGSQSTDPSGNIISYSWVQASGPSAADIDNDSAPTTTVTGLQEGQYVFILTIKDDNGITDAKRVKIIVAAEGNPFAIANAGAEQTIVIPDNTATLDGGASLVPGGSIKSYSWTQSSGPSNASFSNANNVTTDVTNLQQGNYVFQLLITDNDGNTASDEVTVNVNNPAYLQKDFSVEVYGKGIGLIYKRFLHTEYQGPNATAPGGSTTGYGITLNMIDHN